MPIKKKNKSVIAICIQEPTEDGSKMDLGAIDGDNLRFLHQAFITDTIVTAMKVKTADVRLYFIDEEDRVRLVEIVAEYLTKKYGSGKDSELKARFTVAGLERERWGLRIEKIFTDCFDRGYENVLLVGSRTPTISADMMRTALRLLKDSDAVFGPTPEGRYYAIGMSGGYKIKLSDFDWKSPAIYSEVSSAFTGSLSWSELDIWYTVETPDELELLARDINQYRFDQDETTACETELMMERLIAKLGS
jgi:glycosyltransferase A (GT-A) superfamily protein (DUF2064 family)